MIRSRRRDAELRSLLDREAIREQLLRYCRGVDRRDAELLRTVYHPDAIDDHGSFAGGVDELIRQNASQPPGAQVTSSMHLVGNILIDLDGDSASTESYFVSIQTRVIDGVECTRIRSGRYLDRFERRARVWRIAHRRVVDDWSRMDAVGAGAPQLGSLRGRRDREDPVYTRAETDIVTYRGR